MGGLGRMVVVALCCVSAVAGAESKRFWLENKHRKVDRQRSVISEVARHAMPAVVSITTENPPTSEDVVAGNNEPQKGLGSGFIIHPDGYILTSQHVIEGATSIRIKLAAEVGAGPREFEAEVVGQDEATDVALLKINAGRKLPVVPLGSSEDVQIADWIVAIGNPFGLSHSVSVGVISYKGRTEITPNGRQGYFDFLQTDAAINPGNSGGPILDMNGEVVAIANAVNVSGQGIAFALPIDMAKEVLPQLRAQGHVSRSWMGVSVQDLSREVAEAFSVRANRGVVVSEVVPASPGDKAGLKVGDVITELGRLRIERAHTLRWQVATSPADRIVTLKVMRDGRPLSVNVHLARMPTSDEDEASEQHAENAAVKAQAPADQRPDDEAGVGGSGESDGDGQDEPSPQ